MKFILFVAAILLAVWGSRRYIRVIKEWQREDREDLRGSRIPTLEEANAECLYGDQGAQALVECRESHIQGDCPLCGAQ